MQKGCYVCCSICGAIIQKSVISYSETKCGNCGAMLRVFVKNGIVIVAENANTESSKIYQVIKEEMKIE